jgi:hypothetical protein
MYAWHTSSPTAMGRSAVSAAVAGSRPVAEYSTCVVLGCEARAPIHIVVLVTYCFRYRASGPKVLWQEP